MVKLVEIRNNLPPDFYDELGRLVVDFGRVEYMVKLFIEDLGGKGFTAGMADAESRRAFSALCDAAKQGIEGDCCLTNEQKSAFVNLIEMAISLGNYRNDIVHALWTADGRGYPIRIRPKWIRASRSVKWDGGPVSVDELRAKRMEMEQVWQLLYAQRKAWLSPHLST